MDRQTTLMAIYELQFGRDWLGRGDMVDLQDLYPEATLQFGRDWLGRGDHANGRLMQEYLKSLQFGRDWLGRGDQFGV